MNSNFAESVASVKPVRMVNVKRQYRHTLTTRESREKVKYYLFLLKIFERYTSTRHVYHGKIFRGMGVGGCTALAGYTILRALTQYNSLNFLLLNPQFPAHSLFQQPHGRCTERSSTYGSRIKTHGKSNSPVSILPLLMCIVSSIKCNPHNKIHRNRQTELWIVTPPYFTVNANVLTDSLRPCTRAYLVSECWFPVVFWWL